MYFNLPTSHDRQKVLNKKSSNSSIMSTDSSTTKATTVGGIGIMTEDRISEIIHNLDDHWGSPPILTPDTLAHILNHQWINTTVEENEEIKKKVSSAVQSKRNKSKDNTTAVTTTTAIVDKKVISNLIKEFCKTIQDIDTENKYEVTKDLKNDQIIQKYLIASSSSPSCSVSTEGKESSPSNLIIEEEPNNVLEHILELLQHHNKAK